MTSFEPYVLPTSQSEESAPGVTRVASSSVFRDFSSQSSPDWGPHYSNTSPSTCIDQGSYDPVDVQDPSSTFLASGLPFDSNGPDAPFTLADPAQDYVPKISSDLEYDSGSVFIGVPVTNNFLRTGGEVPWCPVLNWAFNHPSILHTIDPNAQALFLSQGMEAFRDTVDPHTCVVGIPPLGWGIDQPEAGFSYTNLPTPNLVYSTSLADGPSFPTADIQVFHSEPETIQSPHYTAMSFEQESNLSEVPTWPCQWQDEDGTVCGEVFTRVTLSEHLARHGIKNMRRDERMECNWIGCRAKAMNRESIVRHIREVHMRLKRPSKPVQGPQYPAQTPIDDFYYSGFLLQVG